MCRDSNPTGCGAEETRKRFPAQHARSGATQRKRAAEAARGHPAGGTTESEKPVANSVAGFLLSMCRDSNPTGCGAEETRKRFPAQHARSGATQRKRAAEAARGHPAGGTTESEKPVANSVAGFLLSMCRDSNPTGCGAEETRKRFPAQHARSEATQRMRAAPAARGHPAGGTNSKMYEPVRVTIARVRSFLTLDEEDSKPLR